MRYSDAPSEVDQRGAGAYEYANVEDSKYRTQSLTLGSIQTVTARLTNEVHFNYSRSRAHSFLTLDNFVGAVPPPGLIALSGGRLGAKLGFSFLRRLGSQWIQVSGG